MSYHKSDFVRRVAWPVCVRLFPLVWLLAVRLAPAAEADAPDTPGAAIYETKCARCHGPDGQGVTGSYEVALTGSRSVKELSRLIERTMPEENPEDCVGEEARLVAQYIYDAFYSPAARVRRGLDQPQQVELMRLTVPQFRNALADVLGHFAASSEQRAREEQATNDEAPQPIEPGLHGSYFSSEGMSKANELILERVDSRIEFDFQAGAPAEGITADQFAIIWEGSLLAEETGEYQLRVTTPNGARLYLNLDATPGLRKLRDDSSASGQAALVDAWVSSGKLREESARIFLLGGRRYPLRIEFFKYKEPAASLKVEWKPPRGAWSVLDRSSVTTQHVGRTFVVETAFPADDRSLGFERGKSVSHEWQVAVANAAISAADEVVARLPLLAGDASPQAREEAAAKATPEEDAAAATERQRRLQDFVVKLARVAFRRPLTAEQEEALRERPFAGEDMPEMSVRRAVVSIFCSPEFLYADLTSPDQSPDQHAIASRLSWTLWDSVPDAELMAAAEAGELQTEEQVARQARRMLSDARARHKIRGFFRHWLEIEDRDLAKDQQLFPEFDEQVLADLRRSLELFLEETVWNEPSDYRQLLTADYLLLNQRLQSLYGEVAAVDEPVEGQAELDTAATVNEFQRTVMPSQERAGVLTHPYLMSALAYHNNTSPIHRGVFLTRNIVGRSLKPPPIAVAFKNDEFAADLTMREKITQLTRDSNCQSCHSVINPLGFALEHYDAVGRWRAVEGPRQRPVDSASVYTTENGDVVEVDSARDIAELALSSESAHRAFVVQLFQHLTKQNPPGYGPAVTEHLRDQFAADQFHIQNLIVRMASLAALHGTTVPSPAAQASIETTR